MNAKRNHYEVLGVAQSASLDDIKKKYREMARQFHPDRPTVEDKSTAQKVFAKINQAYSVLSDPDKRSVYDLSLNPDSQAAGSPVTNAGQSHVPNGTGTKVSSSPEQQANIDRLLNEADTALLQGKLDNARAISQQILKTDRTNSRAYGILGDVLEQSGKPQEAINAYKSALQSASSAIIQAKLNRLQSVVSASPPVRSQTLQPSNGLDSARAPQRNGTSVRKPAETKSTGGFFDRLLGKK